MSATTCSWSNGWPVADGQRLLVKVALLLQRSKSTATTSSLGSGAWDCHTEAPKFGAGTAPTAPTSAENVARSQDMEEADKRKTRCRWIGRENTTLAGSQTKHTVIPHPTVPWCLFRPLGQLLQGKVWWYSDSLPKTCDEMNGPVTIGRVHQQFDLCTQRRRVAEPSHLRYP